MFEYFPHSITCFSNVSMALQHPLPDTCRRHRNNQPFQHTHGLADVYNRSQCCFDCSASEDPMYRHTNWYVLNRRWPMQVLHRSVLRPTYNRNSRCDRDIHDSHHVDARDLRRWEWSRYILSYRSACRYSCCTPTQQKNQHESRGRENG